MSAQDLAAVNSAAIEESNSKVDSAAPAGVPVIDYEGSGYRRDFWEGQGREYEDAVERNEPAPTRVETDPMGAETRMLHFPVSATPCRLLPCSLVADSTVVP